MGSELARPHIGGINHVGISVTNLERSIRFYCDVLGVAMVRQPYGGERAAFSGRMAILALGSQVLDLFEHSANRGERFEPARTGLDHIGLTANSRDELQSWASWLESCDVTCSPIREVENNMGALFDFADPDGIQLEFLFIDVTKLPPQSPEGVFDS
ncbi:lactoylglutathione lyase-like lyase [Mycobacterium sp. JS623]|uniref:VOC family protein n=1 Tax=Mycobacterium sp. JS623 TaxID=212767 RepID=UPI0002A5ACD5|nr:VOC family protein [Mycobacterium sp. JS623]AGB24817.1 lactoylglutathione lyase-like lyase [Mycobacterium sp. JS623]